MQKLKDSYQELLQSTIDVQNDLNKQKKDLNDKIFQIQKIQKVLQVVECDFSEMQSIFWNIQKYTLELKELINQEVSKDIIEQKFELLQETQLQLEEALLSYMFQNQLSLKRTTKQQRDSNKENPLEQTNPGKKKKIQSAKRIIKLTNEQTKEQSDEEEEFIERKKRKPKINQQNIDQSNNLINDIFNFI